MNDKTTAKPLHLFSVSDVTTSKNWGDKDNFWGEIVAPKIVIWFYSDSDKEVTLTIENDKKTILHNQKINAKKGLNNVTYDGVIASNKIGKKDAAKQAKNGKYYLPVSKYKVQIQSGSTIESTSFEIVKDK